MHFHPANLLGNQVAARHTFAMESDRHNCHPVAAQAEVLDSRHKPKIVVAVLSAFRRLVLKSAIRAWE